MKGLLYLGPSGRQFWCKDKEDWRLSDTEPTEPVWVVTDYAEESFIEVEMPRLFGRDRSTYIARQLANRFPDTPYRAVLARLQSSGWMERLAPTRQIFYAINNAERLNNELGTTPVTGIWPISLLISLFCHSSKLPSDLLVVLPDPEALRIVHLKNHTPVLTRLVPTPNAIGAQVEEIIRTRRYLENTRIIERGQICPVLVLGPAADFAGPLTSAQFQIVPPPSPWDQDPPSDWHLLLFDLALRSPPGQVAPIKRRIDYLANRLRHSAWLVSAICLIAALWAASGNVKAIFNTLTSRELALQENSQLLANIAEIEKKSANFGIDPELLRRAINLNEDEIVSIPGFDAHLAALANALAETPDLRLIKLEWNLLTAGAQPCKKVAEVRPAEPPPEGELPKERRIELSIEVALPEQYGPRDQAQVLRKLSQKIGHIKDIKLHQDPARDIDRSVLQSTSGTPAQKSAAWCLSLPGSTKPQAQGEKP